MLSLTLLQKTHVGSLIAVHAARSPEVRAYEYSAMKYVAAAIAPSASARSMAAGRSGARTVGVAEGVVDVVGLGVRTVPGLPGVDGPGAGAPVQPLTARISAAVTIPARTPDPLIRPLLPSAVSSGCPLRSAMSRRYRVVLVRA